MTRTEYDTNGTKKGIYTQLDNVFRGIMRF